MCPAELVSPAGVLWAGPEVLGEWVSVSVLEIPEDVGVDLDTPESPVVEVCARIAVDWPESVGLDSSPVVVICMLERGTAEEVEKEKEEEEEDEEEEEEEEEAGGVVSQNLGTQELASWAGVLAPRLSLDLVTVGGNDPCVEVETDVVDWRFPLEEAGMERLCVLSLGGSVFRELVALAVPKDVEVGGPRVWRAFGET
ncbi:hypothetical protein H920_16612 [Fukomys damarensis]|uniref:Uncharacterized protein n=1 Tax=Fukomys damarensis TaxID=885580 RepID=A0A091CRV7_FUKDA|nr:hypothetical protein H920_16612 [Fukomys damarensis]